MPLETYPFGAAEHMEDQEDVAAFIDAVLEEGDPELTARAVSVVARALGMSEIVRETGIVRRDLYRALNGEGGPGHSALTDVLTALGQRLHASAAA